MLINEEDKIQYNLIEDVISNKVIGSVENIVNFIEDNIKYNLEQGEDAKQMQEVAKAIKEHCDPNQIICIYENPMIGLDWDYIDLR